jgi:ParB family chromosome partitioning protein
MTEIRLSTDLLKKSASNVRAGHTKEDIEMMANSVKHRGIINPPCVALNGDGKYEIIAGNLRVAGAIAAGVDEIRCLDVTAFNDSERVEISLAENIDRREMSALEYYVAFNKLFKAGMPVGKIGERFGKPEREVQQLLAIGSLPKKIIDLAEDGKVGDRTLKALAIASGKDVVRYGKLKDNERPSDWNIHEWLAGDDGMFLASNAFFDIEQYKGPKIVDLFADEDEVWCTGGAEFIMLQNEAINAQIAKHLENDWKVTKLDHWQSWAYDKTAKKDGGQVFYTRSDRTQEVNFYVGYKRQATSGTAPKAKAEGEKKEKPEISQAFADFMAETRHAAVQRHMLDDTRIGMIGAIVLLLKQADNIQFRSGGKNLTDAYSDSLHSSDNKIVVRDDYDNMLEELGVLQRNTWDIDAKEMAEKMLEYTPKTLQRWLVTLIAYKWECLGTDGDSLGDGLGLDTVNIWEADDAFWEGIKNKKTLLKIAEELDITCSDKEPTKIIRKRLAEKRPDTWRPKWLRFNSPLESEQ